MITYRFTNVKDREVWHEYRLNGDVLEHRNNFFPVWEKSKVWTELSGVLASFRDAEDVYEETTDHEDPTYYYNTEEYVKKSVIYKKEPHKCVCTMETIWREGCKCGGT